MIMARDYIPPFYWGGIFGMPPAILKYISNSEVSTYSFTILFSRHKILNVKK